MKIQIDQPCAFWDSHNGRIECQAGARLELADEHARVAVAHGWAHEIGPDKPLAAVREPALSAEDAASGAPARTKAAARRAPSKG